MLWVTEEIRPHELLNLAKGSEGTPEPEKPGSRFLFITGLGFSLSRF
jgi:hypothetical protein